MMDVLTSFLYIFSIMLLGGFSIWLYLNRKGIDEKEHFMFYITLGVTIVLSLYYWVMK